MPGLPHESACQLRQAVAACAQSGEFLRELRNLLSEAQSAVSANDCRACGKCCDFASAGHRLYCSTGELAVLSPGGADSGAPLRCPFQSGRLCLARDNRPLGCRMYFCSARNEEVYEVYHAQVRRLHELHGLPYFYVEMTAALAALAGA